MPLEQGRHFEVRPLTLADAETCDQIILSLPHHFGLEGGRRECAYAVRSCEGLVAVLDGRVVGFLTLQPHFDTAFEITWMAVHARYRGQGIGHHLIRHLRQQLQARGCQLLLVATLAPSVEDRGEDNYARTRAFYRTVGFLAAREIPLYWGEGSQPALLMVMPLGMSE